MLFVLVLCPACDGLGIVADPVGVVHRLGSDEIKCPVCDGKGEIVEGAACSSGEGDRSFLHLRTNKILTKVS